MNPETNRFEPLEEWDGDAALRRTMQALQDETSAPGALLLRPDGSPVPAHWSTFTVGEQVIIKNYTFRVAYIGETAILFEPVGPIVVGDAP